MTAVNSAVYQGYVSPPPMNGAMQGQMAVPVQAPALAKPGTLPPGTSVRIGEYKVYIDRFLSEGKAWSMLEEIVA